MFKLSFKIGLLICTLFILASENSYAQIEINKRTWLSGYARSILAFDNFTNTFEPEDSLTARKLNSGHTLVDLEANIQPNKNLFIHGSTRIRNDQGGFWNSGITFDIRNLYIRGVIGNAVRFQLGDVQYKLTPYTFFNDPQDIYSYMPSVFREQASLINDDLFFDENNTWRQQGLTTDFGFTFKSILEEINVDAFVIRLRDVPAQRLFMGGHIDLIQSKYFSGQINYINTFDWEGTRGATLPEDMDAYFNPVLTGGFKFNFDINEFNLQLETEAGSSFERKVLGVDSLEFNDFFYDATLSGELKDWKLSLSFSEVGPDFRSAAAQTRRLSFEDGNIPAAFSEITNNDILSSQTDTIEGLPDKYMSRSISIFDIMREGRIFNSSLQQNLMVFNPAYNNISPYGAATPNRRMLGANFGRFSEEANWGFDIGLGIGNEIRGQGTIEKRAFTELTLNANYLLEIADNKILESIAFNLNGWLQNTARNSANEFEKIDLQTLFTAASIRFNLPSKFNINTGFIMLNSEGNEFFTDRDAIGSIRNFVSTDINHSEQLIGIGLGYDFNDRNSFDFYYNRTANSLKDREEYEIDNLTLLFKMKF